MSKPVLLWTQVLVVVTSVWLAWTGAAASAAPTAGRIEGQLLAGAAPAPGQVVTLRLYGGVNDVALLTTTTTITGAFVFADPPTPPEGWTYYVEFGPNETHPAYLNYWQSGDIAAYQAGEVRSLGVFDIADVKLVAPTPDSVARLPLTFEWTPRGDSADEYRVHLVNEATGQDTALAAVGYQGTATLSDADMVRWGLKYGERYYWYVEVRRAGGGVGASFGAWDVTFARHQVYLPLLSANPPPP